MFPIISRMPDELECNVNEAFLVPKDRSDMVRLISFKVFKADFSTQIHCYHSYKNG